MFIDNLNCRGKNQYKLKPERETKVKIERIKWKQRKSPKRKKKEQKKRKEIYKEMIFNLHQSKY